MLAHEPGWISAPPVFFELVLTALGGPWYQYRKSVTSPCFFLPDPQSTVFHHSWDGCLHLPLSDQEQRGETTSWWRKSRGGVRKRKGKGKRKEKGEEKGTGSEKVNPFSLLCFFRDWKKSSRERINHMHSILHCFSFRAALPGNWVEPILLCFMRL